MIMIMMPRRRLQEASAEPGGGGQLGGSPRALVYADIEVAAYLRTCGACWYKVGDWTFSGQSVCDLTVFETAVGGR
jgi:hypothetical protein